MYTKNGYNPENINLLIFDLDGVITSEQKYWDTARLSVWELLEHTHGLGLTYFNVGPDFPTKLSQVGKTVIPDSLIYHLKNRSINSNWDITFVVTALHIVGVLSAYCAATSAELPALLQDETMPLAERLRHVGELLQPYSYTASIGNATVKQFLEAGDALVGPSLLDFVEAFALQRLGMHISCLHPDGALWHLCHETFQRWFTGETWPGVLPVESTVIPCTTIEATLRRLTESGRYVLGIATGRPSEEVVEPLKKLSLLSYFDEQRIVMHDHVQVAETFLQQSGERMKLSKPHPFVVFKAIYPDKTIQDLLSGDYLPTDHSFAAFIGDSSSDVLAAKRAGCVSIGVLTGPGGDAFREARHTKLESLGCDSIINDMSELPHVLGL